MSRSPARPDTGSGLPAWMRWTGAGLTAALAVLFVVVLLQVRLQGQKLQALQDRLQKLENTQDLERTDALEEQLRSTVLRLQSLEGLEQALQRLSNEQESLRQQISSGGGGGAAASPEPDVFVDPMPQPLSGGRNRILRPPLLPPPPLEQP